jgi:hypothetical protein
MRIAFPIDGLLTDSQSLKAEWERQLGDEKFQIDAAFWAACKPCEDSHELINSAVQNGWDLYVFACRPKALFLPTRAWLRNHYGLELPKERIIMQALKRYDCRLLGIDIFIDSDLEAIENLKIETVCPIRAYHVDRASDGAMNQTIRRVNEALCNKS